MKRITYKIVAIFALVLLCILPIASPAYATQEHYIDRVVDNAYLLSDSEHAELEYLLDSISKKHQMDVAVYTVDSLGEYGYDIVAFADDTYDYLGYGYGEDADGLMLFISMEERDWYITTTGAAIDAFTDAGLEYIEEAIIDDLSAGNYADAFTIFAETCDDFITQAETGQPFDRANLPRRPLSIITYVICLVIGVVVGVVAVGTMMGQMISVGMQKNAASYVRSGSMQVTREKDMFLYKHVTRKERPKSTSKSGGSSTHRSSSGRSHGGRGGKF